MSVRIMAIAWTVNLATASLKLLLLALADNADDKGKCWPSVRLLAEKCGLTPRSIRSLLTDLERLGHIRIEPQFRDDGSQRSNLYYILPSSGSDEGGSPPVPCAPPPVGAGVPGGPEAAPRALNHQLKSSDEPPPQGASRGGELIQLKFPASLSHAERAEAAARLSALSADKAQLVLDELAGRCKIATVQNPIGYLRSLILRAQAGSFEPDLALQVRENRESRERHLAEMQRREEELRARRGPIKLDHLLPRHRELLLKHIRTAETNVPPQAAESGEA